MSVYPKIREKIVKCPKIREIKSANARPITYRSTKDDNPNGIFCDTEELQAGKIG